MCYWEILYLLTVFLSTRLNKSPCFSPSPVLLPVLNIWKHDLDLIKQSAPYVKLLKPTFTPKRPKIARVSGSTLSIRMTIDKAFQFIDVWNLFIKDHVCMPVHKGLIRRRPNVDKCTQSTACYRFHWTGLWIMIHFQYLLLVFVISLTKIFSSFLRNKSPIILLKCTLVPSMNPLNY